MQGKLAGPACALAALLTNATCAARALESLTLFGVKANVDVRRWHQASGMQAGLKVGQHRLGGCCVEVQARGQARLHTLLSKLLRVQTDTETVV